VDERTEEDALAGVLLLKVGGEPVVLRVLSIEESDDWQRRLGAAVAALDVPGEGDGMAMFNHMLIAGSDAKLEMVLAYDVDHKLGSREDIRKRMTKAELAAAFEAILDAENPKEEAANRSVAEAFGRPQLLMRVGLEMAQSEVETFLRARSLSGRSPTGDSTPQLSVIASPENGSSSSGATARSGRAARRASTR
jgi:hypothetical protein